jgi:serine/threonine-protein kinase
MRLRDLDPTQFARVSQLFDEALAIPGERREAWLADLAAREPELASIVSELVTSPRAEAETLLETRDALNRRFVAATQRSLAGRQFGPYRILSELGRGGMGSVWLAERADGLFARKVALKLLHTSLVGSALSERFARERTILAGLSHPRIARLLDAGFSDDGQPYLAIEYVEGIALTTYCDVQRLTLAARAGLMVQVLSAVQYAHRNLVIHRDLKPSNILVTQAGEVCLLDFGIAKLMSDGEARETELTEISGRALTPDYASPEQVAGAPITTASDVYSLGVVLYELLCGSRPYRLRRDSRGALEDAILSAEAVRPSQSAITPEIARARSTTARKLSQMLAGDLDTIALKALKKEPAERYATADAFLQDLQRYLKGEPVLARPDSAAYRIRKFVYRNWFAVALATGAGLALVGATAASVWQARVASEHARVAQREANRAQAVQGFLLDIFRANSDAQPDPLKARQTTARELLDIGATRVAGSLKDSPEAQQEVLATLGTMYWQLGLDEKAADMEWQGLQLLKRTYGERDLRVVDAMLDYVEDIAATSRRNDGLPLLTEAKSILDAHGDQSELRGHLLLEYARFYSLTDVERSRAYAEDTLAFYAQHYPRAAKRLGAVSLLAVAQWNRGDFADAERRFVELSGELLRMDVSDVAAVTATAINLSAVRADNLELAQAEQDLRRILEQSRRVNGETHINTVTAEARLGALLHATGRRSEAMRLLDDVVAKVGDGTPNTLPHITTLVHRLAGAALVADGRLAQAQPPIAMDVEETQKFYPGSVRLAEALRVQGVLLTALGRYADAGRALDRALELRRSALGSGAPPAAYNAFLLDQARLRLARGEAASAIEALDRVAPPASATDLPRKRDAIAVQILRSQALLQQDRTVDARDAAARAVAEISASPLRDYLPSLEAEAALRLGQAQHRGGDAQAARVNLERAVALRAATGDPTASPWLAEAQIALADCLVTLGRRQDAKGLLAGASAIQARQPELGNHLRTGLPRIQTGLAAGR